MNRWEATGRRRTAGSDQDCPGNRCTGRKRDQRRGEQGEREHRRRQAGGLEVAAVGRPQADEHPIMRSIGREIATEAP